MKISVSELDNASKVYEDGSEIIYHSTSIDVLLYNDEIDSLIDNLKELKKDKNIKQGYHFHLEDIEDKKDHQFEVSFYNANDPRLIDI